MFTDCSETQCSTCLNALHPECFWCQSSIACGTTGDTTCTTSTTAVGQCPSKPIPPTCALVITYVFAALSMVAPSSVSTIGGEVVFLEGSFRFTEATVTSVQCIFEQQNATFSVTASNYTNTGVTCTSPESTYHSGSNDTFVYIAVNGKKYTNSIPFEFYGKCNTGVL
jgi:hypothetical protein